MGLTMAHGPLAPRRPREVNYRIDGPEHLLLLGEFPRRVRAFLGGHAVLDTTRGRLLHETGSLPVLYVPDADVAAHLLRPTDLTTADPYRGLARYWSVHVDGRTVENAAWDYPDPESTASWLRGHKAFSWDAMDSWYDEDEEVFGHLRDPFHRVDARTTTRRVRVRAGDEVIAESTRAKVLSETGLPNRYYVPREDVRAGLRRSSTRTVCPYKGTATYWSTENLQDVGWSYEDPLEESVKIGGHVCFHHDAVEVEVAGASGAGAGAPEG